MLTDIELGQVTVRAGGGVFVLVADLVVVVGINEPDQALTEFCPRGRRTGGLASFLARAPQNSQMRINPRVGSTP